MITSHERRLVQKTLMMVIMYREVKKVEVNCYWENIHF